MDIHTFDAHAYLAAVEPPRFLGGDREYVGVVLSAPEWFKLDPVLAQLQQDPRKDLALIRELCDVFFPPPPRPRWWNVHRPPREKSVAERVGELPYNLQLDAILTFVAAQVAAHRWTVPGLRPKKESESTSGSASPG